MIELFATKDIEYIIHAAALKQVPALSIIRLKQSKQIFLVLKI